MLTDIKYFFRGLDESVVGRCQTKRGKTGSGKSNQRKARYQHLMVMTHPTIQHAHLNWLTCFEIRVWNHFPVFWSEKYSITCVFWSYLQCVQFVKHFKLWVTHSRAYLASWREGDGASMCLSWKTLEENEKPSTWELSLCSLEKQEEDEKSSRPDWLQGWQKNGFPRNDQVKRDTVVPQCGVFQKPINLLVFLSQQVPPTR